MLYCCCLYCTDPRQVREAAFPLDDASEYAAGGSTANGMGDLPPEDSSHADTPGSGSLAAGTPALSSALANSSSSRALHRGAGSQPSLLSVSNFAFGGPGATAAETLVAAAGKLGAATSGSGNALPPPIGPAGWQPSVAIVQISFCERSKQVVLVLGDGACAVCATSDGGLAPLSELCFGRWLCGPERRVVCAQVGARAQLIAVGRDNGDVDLFRCRGVAVAVAAMGVAATPAGVARGRTAVLRGQRDKRRGS